MQTNAQLQMTKPIMSGTITTVEMELVAIVRVVLILLMIQWIVRMVLHQPSYQMERVEHLVELLG